ncbi:type II CRISPR RNA-guided endonuclease Cas9 [Botrimarina mediterranea]|uniref:type II CRISPR RNA-guided endonuclease Cas9 n=1 Tax=Botrimarina mediterranea TaxID=2528022 RepID=UPI00118A4CB0|nr:CRISPR-associated endonuclease Cas9 [Planctomycetes bacterium K2D]
MSNLVLGLDLGPNSIGWALVRDDDAGEIVATGVRVFPEGVDAFDTSKEKSRNEDRRIARGMRRQIRRRVARRRKLVDALIKSGLWPAGSAPQEALYRTDPWELRVRGLTEALTPHEFGRVILHLNQRRGFWSNRKRDREDKEAEGMKAEINANRTKQREAGLDSIGAYLAPKLRKTKEDHCAPRGETDERKVRGLHLGREDIYGEFDALWKKQAECHPGLLTDTLRWGTLGPINTEKTAIAAHKPIPKHDERRKGKSDLEAFGIHGLVFFQRPIFWPKSVVGLCELEPKQRRCPRADRHAEQFRLLQEVNNLRYADPDSNEEQPLLTDHRAVLLDYLATMEKATFDQIRKKLGFLDSVKFNLEHGKRAAIKGMTLDWLFAKQLGKDWHKRTDDEKDAIVTLLRENESDDDLVIERLINEFGFDAKQAEAALDINLPVGYVNLSRMAIDKLLPHLERGLVYQSLSDPEVSALHAAGYLRRDELQRRLFDKLPDLRRVNPADCKLGDLPNPVVRRALVEVRQLVNAIIREYGKPDQVHVEMARGLAMGPKARSEYNSRVRKNEAAREEAAKAIRNVGERPSRDAVMKYRLWQEQAHECIYCGKTISQEQLFGGATDIDHVLPYSRCLDDSQGNKVVCHRECNHEKGQQTPYEWVADRDRPRYDAICQRAGSLLRKGLLPYPKYRRFLQKELKLDGFIARQLTDTGYICRATVEYLQLLFDKPSCVLGLKGQLTAELRWQWGLDTILSELPDSPAWQASKKLRDGEKNRADHRHHAIDAIVVALTNRSRLQKLSELVKRGGGRSHGEILFEPWNGLRDEVAKKIAAINVSHRVERKVRGALHEETLYGPTEHQDEWVVRKPVDTLSITEIARIRDLGIRNIVIEKLGEAGMEVTSGKKLDPKKIKQALANLRMPSGVPIKRVRILKHDQTIAPLREDGSPYQSYVKTGSTHHLCIFEHDVNGKKVREPIFVSMLEATARLKRGQPIIQRTHPRRANAHFVMTLATRECVLANVNGTQRLLVFVTSKSTTGELRFVDANDARRRKDQRLIYCTPNTLNARKVTVDSLGRIRWAND